MTEPSPIQGAVAAALTGLPIPDVAAQYGMERTILSDAVAVYDQAGREALARHAATTDWWQAYLHFTDWADADTTFTAHVLPVLREAEAAGPSPTGGTPASTRAGACACSPSPKPN
ncbi:hypothetical protein NKH18_07425 [Streptomyces sp. M10(2022)]